MYKWNYKKCFSNLLTAAAVVGVAWYALSYLEIIIKNTAPGPEYSNINFFIIFMEVFAK
jgi:hypothetical protein